MVSKYVRKIENREFNPETESTWSTWDVPAIWKNKVVAKIEADHYYIDENDGTAYPIPPNEE